MRYGPSLRIASSTIKKVKNQEKKYCTLLSSAYKVKPLSVARQIILTPKKSVMATGQSADQLQVQRRAFAHSENKQSRYRDVLGNELRCWDLIFENIVGSSYYYARIGFSLTEKWPEKNGQAPIYYQSHSLLTNNGRGMFF